MAKKIKRKSPRGKASPLPPLPSRKSMERVTADLHRLLEGQQFQSLDEANTFLQGHLSEDGRIPQSAGRSSLEKAQDLAWDAWDAPTDRQAAKLARQALAISPDCADAYNVLAQMEAGTPTEVYELYRKAVDAGERSLGRAFFEEHKGHFWGLLKTRPYMRARQGLADSLWSLGQEEKAIAHYEAILELNPGDNQGIRDTLLSRYLTRGNDAGVSRLYEQYPDDWSASFLWSRVLLECRRGDHRAAAKALRQAMQQNPHVPDYLLGTTKLPRHLPDSYSVGGEDEAVLYIFHFGEAWVATPAALTWLFEQTKR